MKGLSITEPKKKNPPICPITCAYLHRTEAKYTCDKYGVLNTRTNRSTGLLPIRKESCKHTII